MCGATPPCSPEPLAPPEPAELAEPAEHAAAAGPPGDDTLVWVSVHSRDPQHPNFYDRFDQVPLARVS